MPARILLVEDEAAIREMLCFTLGRAGFEVIEAEDVPSADCRVGEKLPDLMLVDWMLPGGTSGVDWVRRIKRDELTREVPVILLTARGEEDDKVLGLEAGADDYMTKPFSNRELVARIKAHLRRAPGANSEGEVVTGKLCLNSEAHRVSVAGDELSLGPTEYRLLHFFMTHPERVYTRAQLLDFVWSRDTYVEERTVDVHVLRLRKVLTPHACEGYVQTVRGVGYRFSAGGDS